MGNKADSEDLSQCVLIEVLRSAGSFRGESTLDHWVDRVTVQTAAKQFEKRDRRRKIGETIHIEKATARGLEESAGLCQLRDRLAAAFATLSPNHRIPLVLHYLHDYAAHEIASLTDTKVNTVRGRLRAGKKKIREVILADPVLSEWVEEVRKI